MEQNSCSYLLGALLFIIRAPYKKPDTDIERGGQHPCMMCHMQHCMDIVRSNKYSLFPYYAYMAIPSAHFVPHTHDS